MAFYDSYLSKCLTGYQHKNETRNDVVDVLEQYRSLTFKLESFVFNDGTSKELLNINGTIPIVHKNITYNIPICIWLMDTHPYNAPLAYVCPPSDAKINASTFVDPNGEIHLPYLHEWNPVGSRTSSSDLLAVIQVMIATFGEVPPMYAKTPAEITQYTMQAIQSTPAQSTQTYSSENYSAVGASKNEVSPNVVDYDSFLSKCLVGYEHHNQTRKDVVDVLEQYRGLTFKRENFVFNDGTSRELLNINGTIPIVYRYNMYHIPICIWLMDTHPYKAPLAYVQPTPDMQVLTSMFVDHNGEIHLPYLHEWNPSSSDLLGLIEVMIITFGDMPPVRAKP